MSFSAQWLALREPYDMRARNVAVLDALAAAFRDRESIAIVDLACGAGASLRALAPRLPPRLSWRLGDNDLGILARTPALAAPPRITVQARAIDLARDLELALDGPLDLITCSALLDLLSADELDRLVRSCASARCPVLITLTVTGAVRLSPRHPLDELVAAAFNGHQRRTTGGRRLLGPDAADTARRMFTELGCDVVGHASPWRLGPARRQLTYAWFAGWLAAACEQDSHLATATRSYARVRLAGASAGRLQALVQHRDLLVRSPRRPGQPDADRPRTR